MNIISRSEAVNNGLAYYFTGKPCKYGHIKERHVGNKDCVECRIQYREKNKDKIAAYRDENKSILYQKKLSYREKNKEEISKYNKKYRKENSEELKAKAATYNIKNRALLAKRCANYYSNNKSKVAARCARYRRENPEAFFVRDSLHRIFKNWRGGRTKCESVLGYTYEELRAHLERQFTKGMSWDNRSEWHIDHIISISTHINNGETDPAIINCLSNLQPIWASENMSKGSKVLTLC